MTQIINPCIIYFLSVQRKRTHLSSYSEVVKVNTIKFTSTGRITTWDSSPFKRVDI